MVHRCSLLTSAGKGFSIICGKKTRIERWKPSFLSLVIQEAGPHVSLESETVNNKIFSFHVPCEMKCHGLLRCKNQPSEYIWAHVPPKGALQSNRREIDPCFTGAKRWMPNFLKAHVTFVFTILLEGVKSPANAVFFLSRSETQVLS